MKINSRTHNLQNLGRENKIQVETEKMGLVRELGESFKDTKILETFKKT